MQNSTSKHSRFILDNTSVIAPPHVPEIRLHTADEAHDLWHKTEEELEQIGLQPPFWAFAWAGGQGLARYILDHPETVHGKHVMDFASGSGLVGIAAKMAGAFRVTCVDIDPFCASAISLNADLNRQDLTIEIADLTQPNSIDSKSMDCVLAGDVFYDRQIAQSIQPLFRKFVEAGKTVLVGDPGRSYLPKSGLARLATYEVEVTRQLEDSEVKQTTVWQMI